jgi:photosystem II stability/assembly factor-like uncharacterized protein
MIRSILVPLLFIVSLLPASVCRAQYVLTHVADGGFGLHFIDDHQGFAFGGNSITYTGDAGYSWSTIVPNVSAVTGCEGMFDCSFVSRRVGWLLAHTLAANPDSSFLYGTTDGGLTWKRLRASAIASVPYASHRFSAIHFVDEMNGWVVGKGMIDHTSDGGKTWSSQLRWPEHDANNDWLDCCYFRNAREGWAAGYGSIILHTSDGGVTWETQHTDSATYNGIILNVDYYYIRDIHFSDSLNGVAAANNGNYLRTTDGGRSWLPGSTRFPNDNVGVQVLDENVIWQTGGDYCDNRGCFSGQSILYTRDGGKSWLSLKDRTIGLLGAGAQFHGIHFINPRLGYVADELGEIFRIVDTSAAVAGVDDVSGPASALALFPQPARDELHVDLPTTAGDASVSVYDLDGRRMISMPAARISSMTIGTSGLNPGVYMLEVASGNGTLRRKFVVAR